MTFRVSISKIRAKPRTFHGTINLHVYFKALDCPLLIVILGCTRLSLLGKCDSFLSNLIRTDVP